jgi:hypothetical protein
MLEKLLEIVKFFDTLSSFCIDASNKKKYCHERPEYVQKNGLYVKTCRQGKALNRSTRGNVKLYIRQEPWTTLRRKQES